MHNILLFSSPDYKNPISCTSGLEGFLPKTSAIRQRRRRNVVTHPRRFLENSGGGREGVQKVIFGFYPFFFYLFTFGAHSLDDDLAASAAAAVVLANNDAKTATHTAAANWYRTTRDGDRSKDAAVRTAIPVGNTTIAEY